MVGMRQMRLCREEEGDGERGMREFVLATRGSLLAMAQAREVKHRLEELGVSVTIRKVETKGDRDREHALREIGGDGLFVRGIERELLEGRADLAVHCGNDLPYQMAPRLTIAGVPEAADARDCLICPEGMPESSIRIIGTGSPRRAVQLEK